MSKTDPDNYTYQLEQAVEAILEEFEPSEDLGFDIFDYNGDPVKVSESLSEAIMNAEKLLYSTDAGDNEEDY